MVRKIPVPVSFMSGVKRSANGNVAAPPAKKLHPLFTGGVKEPGSFLPSPPTLIHFLHLDPFASSSSSLNPLPTPAPTPASSKTAPLPASVSAEEKLGESSNGSARAKVRVVFYDLDGTLIKPKGTNRFPTSREDWAWWHPSVPNRLKAEWEDGKHLIVISNQGDAREKIRKEWKAKLSLIVAKMPAEVPIRILAALNKYDIYRKPNVGMYQVVKQLYEEKGLEVDLENSLFVGDAAGRLGGGKGKVKDHSDTDYKFALNVGVKFVTPEEYFLGEPKQEYPEPPNGFLPSKVGSLANLPPVVPSNKPIVRTEKEIVLFVGPPASGKTSFFKKHFAPRGYEHINQDLMGRREKCLIAAEASLASGRSVVIETGRLVPYGFHSPLDFTRQYGKSTFSPCLEEPRSQANERFDSLFHFLCPIALAKHNSVYRAIYAPKTNPPRELLPGSAFSGYVAQFQEPSLDEGFDELRGVNFVFEGSEDERKKWDMWMLEVK